MYSCCAQCVLLVVPPLGSIEINLYF